MSDDEAPTIAEVAVKGIPNPDYENAYHREASLKFAVELLREQFIPPGQDMTIVDYGNGAILVADQFRRYLTTGELP